MQLKAFYGLPEEVKFCKVCTISNQRPSSVVEYKNNVAQKKPTIEFDEQGVCSACRFSEIKNNKINWSDREKELMDLCDQFRSKGGKYDCVVPGSGGKDSVFVSHILKYKYKMNPLTVTWAPHRYTDIGWKNFQSWIHAGFDNILFTPNGKVHRQLTKLAFLNLVHPFQPFIIGQRQIGPKHSYLYNIPLVFYGENQAEYGNNIKENDRPNMDPSFFSGSQNLDDFFLGGCSLEQLKTEYSIPVHDLQPYLPLDNEKIQKAKTQVHYLSYYLKWDPQECFYYAQENVGFVTNPERTEGTYSKYSSIDDMIDYLHYYTTYIKFGIGRSTYDSCQEVRNKKITREEGVALVKRYDGEFPKKYFKENLEYLGITEREFYETIDKARSPHLWEKRGAEWILRHQVN